MKERLKAGIKAMAMERELLFNSGMIFGASLLGAIFLLISNIILSRHFGPDLFGNFKTIGNLFLFLPAIIELGIGQTLTKYIAKLYPGDPGGINRLVIWFLKLRLVTYLTLSYVIFIFKDQIALYFLKDASLSYLILPGIILSLCIFFEVFKSISMGFQNFKVYSFSQFLTLALTGILTLVLGYYFGIYYAIIGWGLSYLLGNISNFKLSFDKKVFQKSENKLDVKRIFVGYSIPIYLTAFPTFLGIATVPILSLLFPQRLIGYYAFALTFSLGISLIPNALYLALFPKVSELYVTKDFEKAKSSLKKAFALYTPVVFIGIMGILAFSNSIIATVAPAYLPGLMIFKVLTSFYLISGYIQIYRSYLSALAEMKKLVIWTTIQNLSLLLLSWIILSSA